MFTIKKDRWLDVLFKMRRNHAQEVQAFHNDECFLIEEMHKLHRFERKQVTQRTQYASLACKQVERLKQFKKERNIRYQALKRRQAEELYNLMHYKMSTSDIHASRFLHD